MLVYVSVYLHTYISVQFLAHYKCYEVFSSVQFSSVTQLCLTLCDPIDHSTPGFSVHHQFLEFTQTHVY